jgi:hypothetical protein
MYGRRIALKRLKKFLGEENFYAGRLPYSVVDVPKIQR